MTLKPESRWSATLIQLTTLVAVVFGGGWYARDMKGDMTEVKGEVAGLRHDLAAVQKKMDTQYITWPVAKLYASETRRANAALPLFLPDIEDYQKANRAN